MGGFYICPAVCLAVTLLLAVIIPSQADEPDWVDYQNLSLDILSHLIRFDTTNPPGNELPLMKYLSRRLKKEGVHCEIFKSDLNRANLIARCKGDGSQGAFMIAAHADVVSVEGQKWNYPPFEAVIDDGYIYGRGAMDDKGMLALGAAVLIMLKREKIPLSGDVILLVTADEEAGGGKGIQWMLRRHPDKLKADFALNEGGRIYMNSDTVQYAGIATNEKVTYNARLTASGHPGHSSVPNEYNAVYRLAGALKALEEAEMPGHLIPPAREFFAGLAPFEPNIRYDPVRDEVTTSIRRYNAMTKDTFIPTMLQASVKNNILPEKAEAVINCRLLPDSDPEVFFQYLREIINEDSILQLDYIRRREPQMPTSPTTSDLYLAIRETVSRFWPNALCLPSISTGSTDSGKLRKAGIPTYGLLPFPLSSEDSGRMHGPDERLKIEDYYTGLRFLYQLTIEIAAASEKE
ncbi:M20/M25/M40 family metallo-hydrolase [bacterium]|nr:M20/M25/M40 family metallo-hydrolase [FCB group bacterium]MBL7191436.1 M20/M25/M40 family metallo-hydrolase [bacterium]